MMGVIVIYSRFEHLSYSCRYSLLPNNCWCSL